MPPRLFAISDLHVNRPANRAALAGLGPHPDDWLIVAGDTADRLDHVAAALTSLADRFARIITVPGNHELWARRDDPLRGVARYRAFCEVARACGAVTPEDPFPVWEGEGGPAIIAPLLLLYDWSFRPPSVALADVQAWAAEDGIRAADDRLLDAAPHRDVGAWCRDRLLRTVPRLERAARRGLPLVLVNHYPLRRDLVRFGRIARYTPWCGTTATERWHVRFGASVVVSGHLHMRATDWRDGVRFEEVALGYPRHWRVERTLDSYLRPILPGPAAPAGGEGGPLWRP